MEDYEEFNEGISEIDNIIKEQEMQEKLIELKLNLARENYDMLIKNGVDITGMVEMGMDIYPIKETLNQMLQIFEETEEYEKCATLSKLIKQVDEYIIS